MVDFPQSKKTSSDSRDLPPVVFVDDNEVELVLATSFYQKSSLKNPFMAFGGGEELLKYVDSVHSGSAQMPAIVFLDMRMSGFCGIDTLKALRGKGECPFRPAVYFLTHERSTAVQDLAYQYGADGFANKPLGKTEYIEFFDGLADVIETCSRLVE